MKILKNTTYRGLVADQKNLVTLAEKHRRLEGEFKSVSAQSERRKAANERLEKELTEVRAELKKYHRQRGSGGKFVKKQSNKEHNNGQSYEKK